MQLSNHSFFIPIHTHSLPITVCWDIEAMNISRSLPLSMNTGNITCDNDTTVTLNVSSDEVVKSMTFDEIGDFEFFGLFTNIVSNKTGRFPFRVVPSKLIPTGIVMWLARVSHEEEWLHSQTNLPGLTLRPQ